MKPNWQKRLDKVAVSMMPHTDGVIIISLEGESGDEFQQRVARWQAGEQVEGVDQSYTGRECSVWVIECVDPPKRDE